MEVEAWLAAYYLSHFKSRTMAQIHFYGAETKSKHIIAYGDVKRERKFKITYSDSRYFSHRLVNGAYNTLGESKSLEGAKELCVLSIQ